MATARPLQNNILIIEDDKEIRESLQDILTDEGYQVFTAENGALGLAYLQQASVLPALILLDISMPVLDGYGFREAQENDPRIANIPTAMISADGHVKEKANRAGLLEYLRKPLELRDLLNLVDRYCSGTQSQ